jgi:uncharacterized LabA/DUF88 family protein
MVDRVAVFIDYENTHRTGHQLFSGPGRSRHETAIDPRLIADAVLAKRIPSGELSAVHVFRGRPLPQFQPKATSANDMLAAQWSKDPRVHVVRRDLKYVKQIDGTFRAQEKGIDVALAIALVEGAINRRFDVGILFSNDTDQLPTLEFAFTQTKTQIEIACWQTAKPLWFPAGLRGFPPARLPYCHFLTENDFANSRAQPS